MNALVWLLGLAGVIYGIFCDGTFWKIYGVLVLLYTVFIIMFKNARENTKRKTMLISSWGRK